MKTRVAQVYCSIKHRQVLVVQKWISEQQLLPVGDQPPRTLAQWEPVLDFELDQYDKARGFARQLSLPPPELRVRAEFHDGLELI